MSKKKTITKIMTLKDYITLAWMFEKPAEPIPDLCEFDPVALSKETKYSFRLTDAQKDIFDDYFDKFVTAGGIDLIMAKIPRVKGSEQLAKKPTQIIANVVSVKEGQAEAKLPVDASDIDYAALVDSIESGQYDTKGLIKFLDDNFGSASKILSVPTPYEIKQMRSDYSDCEEMYMVIQRAEQVKAKIDAIMNEPEPSEEETLQRFKNHVLYARASAVQKETGQYCKDCDEIEAIEGNKIVFCTALDKIVEYDKAQDLKDDALFLIKNRKLDVDLEIDVFGKATSGNKIIAQLYKKYPNGIPGGGDFYASRKEAYLAGALEI